MLSLLYYSDLAIPPLLAQTPTFMEVTNILLHTLHYHSRPIPCDNMYMGQY